MVIATLTKQIDAVLYEDLTPRDAAGNETIVTFPDGRRSLRFNAIASGHGSSRVDVSDRSWTEVDLYRLADGRVVGTKAQRFAGTSAQRAPSVSIAADAASIVLAFTRPGTGWVEAAVCDAIAELRADDPAIAAEVGAGNVAAWGRELVGEAELMPGDGRFKALAALAIGARLLTIDEAGAPRVRGWKPPEETVPGIALPDVSERLFLALSRQHLPNPNRARGARRLRMVRNDERRGALSSGAR